MSPCQASNRVPYIENFILHFSLALRIPEWLRSIGIQRLVLVYAVYIRIIVLYIKKIYPGWCDLSGSKKKEMQPIAITNINKNNNNV